VGSDFGFKCLLNALIRLRGLADHFEKEDPAMHKTNTVDYAVAYGGEIWLELDDAKTIHLISTASAACKTVHATRGETKARSR
jgi:hypothetical protein